MTQLSNLAVHHLETVFKLFQYEIDQESRSIVLKGSDDVIIQANNLWMFSSLVRTLIGSSEANEEALILIPDHHSSDIITMVKILNTFQVDDIVFTENVKDILDSIGVNIRNVERIQYEEEENESDLKEVIRSNLIDELIHNKQVEQVLCWYCSKSFTGKRAKDKYRSHLGHNHFISEMTEEIRKYFNHNHKCTECGKAYVTKTFKRKHLTKHHSYLVDKILKLVNRKENEQVLEQVDQEAQNVTDSVTMEEEVKQVEQTSDNIFTKLLDHEPEEYMEYNDAKNPESQSSEPEKSDSNEKVLKSSGENENNETECENAEESDDDSIDNEENDEVIRNILQTSVSLPKIEAINKDISELKEKNIQDDQADDSEESENAEVQSQLMLQNDEFLDSLLDSSGEDDDDDPPKDVENDSNENCDISTRESEEIQRTLLLDQDLDSDSDSDDEEADTDTTQDVRISNPDPDKSTLDQPNKSTFNCELCPRKYKSKGGLRVHHSRNHKKINKKKSDSGDAANVSKINFRSKKSHSRKLMSSTSEIDTKIDKMVMTSKKGFTCFLCGKKYERRCHIVSHCETHLNYTHKCPLCSEEFKTRFSVKNHIAKKHRLEKN